MDVVRVPPCTGAHPDVAALPYLGTRSSIRTFLSSFRHRRGFSAAYSHLNDKIRCNPSTPQGLRFLVENLHWFLCGFVRFVTC